MEMWFTEKHTADVKFSIRVDRQIYTGQSDFQRIDVFESKEFGRFLTLDGYMMLTERDEFIYHEMITHVPMAVHPAVRNVLVIGAGDGGVVRELTRYPALENIDMVEIDPLVVEVSKKYLPQTACRLNDERVHIYYEDGTNGAPDSYEKAVSFFSKAKADNDASLSGAAAFFLSKCYRFGRGVPKDVAKADTLLKEATEKGWNEAKTLDDLLKKVTTSD